MTDKGDQPQLRRSPRIEKEVPVKLVGMSQDGFAFEGVAVGLSTGGMGLRTSDPILETATLRMLMRQAFRVFFEIDGIEFSEIICKILRIERSKQDPTKDYFIAVKFIQISDLDELNLQTYIRFYAKKKDEIII